MAHQVVWIMEDNSWLWASNHPDAKVPSLQNFSFIDKEGTINLIAKAHRLVALKIL